MPAKTPYFSYFAYLRVDSRFCRVTLIVLVGATITPCQPKFAFRAVERGWLGNVFASDTYVPPSHWRRGRLSENLERRLVTFFSLTFPVRRFGGHL